MDPDPHTFNNTSSIRVVKRKYTFVPFEACRVYDDCEVHTNREDASSLLFSLILSNEAKLLLQSVVSYTPFSCFLLLHKCMNRLLNVFNIVCYVVYMYV